MGNMQAKALGFAIKYSKAENLNVINNRLTSDGAYHILENVNPTLKLINISNNSLLDLDKIRALKSAQFAKSEAGRDLEMQKT